MKTLNFILVLLLVTATAHAGKMCITLPDLQASRIITSYSSGRGYEPLLFNIVSSTRDVPNPESRTKFMKRMLRRDVKAVVKDYEGKQAAKVAKKLAEKNVEDNVDINK